MRSSHSIPYRPEIDGLRALAVIPVVLYHAGFGFPGGFAGVDVFFVISGYLIGLVIVREAEAGEFSFLNFWGRRLRRLFPAWAVVVTATTVASLFWLIPSHLVQFGESLLYQPIMAANIYFWNQTGYFEPASEFQPLLHTWSLAVEEQFYLFLPLVLLLILPLGRRAVRAIVGGFIVVSLALSVYYSARFPGFAFFMLPTRIWELDLGLILALIARNGFQRRALNEGTSLLGIILISASFFLFDQNTVFPGYAAMLPCLGAALFIFSTGGSATRGSQWLSHPFPVWVGKISYPLYLWHWPVLVFIRYLWISEPPVILLAAGVLASFGLAWVTWRWVENPVRGKVVFPGLRSLAGAALITSLLLLAAGSQIRSTDGFPGRFSPEVIRLMKSGERGEPDGTISSITDWEKSDVPCLLGDREGTNGRILVWGDSHAEAVSGVLDELGKEYGISVALGFQAGVAPIPGTYTRGRESDAPVASSRVMAAIDQGDFDAVLFVAKWAMYVYGRPDGKLDRILQTPEIRADLPRESAAIFASTFPALINSLESRGIETYVMRTVGVQPRSVPETLAQIESRGRDLNSLALSASVHREKDSRMNELLDSTLQGTGAEVLDPLPFFVDENGIYLMEKGGQVLYRDRDHLSPLGAELLRPLFEPIFQQAARK